MLVSAVSKVDSYCLAYPVLFEIRFLSFNFMGFYKGIDKKSYRN